MLVMIVLVAVLMEVEAVEEFFVEGSVWKKK